MFLLNGKKIDIDTPREIDGVRYPNLRDPALREKLGVVELPGPVRPDDRYYYITENEDGTLNITAKPLDQVLPSINSQIKAHRDNLIQTGGAKVGTDWYHSDTHSKMQQIGLVMLGANLPAGLKWKTMDGSFVALTQSLASQIFAAQVAQEQGIFATAEGHIAALAALPDVEQIAAYDWKTGWPEVYDRCSALRRIMAAKDALPLNEVTTITLLGPIEHPNTANTLLAPSEATYDVLLEEPGILFTP